MDLNIICGRFVGGLALVEGCANDRLESYVQYARIFVSLWDLAFEKELSRAIGRGVADRCKLQLGFVNMSQEVLSDELTELLTKGNRSG